MLPQNARSYRAIVTILITLVIALTARASRAAEAGDSKSAGRAAQLLRGLPMAFEPNVGQAGPDVEYVARSAGYSVSLTPGGMALQLDGSAAPAGLGDALSAAAADLSHDFALANRAETWDPLRAHDRESAGETVLMRLIGARNASRATPRQKLPGTVNYLLGNDCSKWRITSPHIVVSRMAKSTRTLTWSTTATRKVWSSTSRCAPAAAPKPSASASPTPRART